MKELRTIINKISVTFNSNGKLLIFGNGGSSSEASHLASEFIGIGLPAIALNDPSVITALSNDYAYNEVFSRQVLALGQPHDLVIGISSSGKSPNVLQGFQIASNMGLEVIDFPRIGKTQSEIQENQLRLIHKIYLHFKV